MKFTNQFLLENFCIPKEVRKEIRQAEGERAVKAAKKSFDLQQEALLSEAVEGLMEVSFPEIPNNADFPEKEAIVIQWLDELPLKEVFLKIFENRKVATNFERAWRKLFENWEVAHKESEDFPRVMELLEFVVGSHSAPAFHWQQFDKDGNRGW